MRMVGIGLASAHGARPTGEIDISSALCFVAEDGGATVGMERVGDAPAVYLQYSTDGEEWKPFIAGRTIVDLPNPYDQVYIVSRGYNASFCSSEYDYNRFVTTGSIKASGDVMSLVDASQEVLEIPAKRYFMRLFEGCEGLLTVPELPATSLTESCYREMFAGCTSIEEAPVLPAIKLADSCYYGMFAGCTGLVECTEIMATVVSVECCRQMFSGCKALKVVNMPRAKTLASGCYREMFKDCTSLQAVSKLVAYDLVEDCYREMFKGCSNLSFISTHQVGFDGCTEWVSGVSEQGFFQYDKGNNPILVRGESACPISWKTADFSEDMSADSFVVQGGGKFGFLRDVGTKEYGDLQVSYDMGNTWQLYDWTYVKATNYPVCFRGDMTTLMFVHFKTEKGAFTTTGSLFNLLSENYTPERVFQGLFSNSLIAEVPYLPNPFAEYCYAGMFSGCPLITEFDGFGATKIPYGSLSGMFSDCTGLSRVKELMANEIDSYGCQAMFRGCASLRRIDRYERIRISAKNGGCNQMFKDSGLEEFDTITYHMDGDDCFQSMFEGCKSLHFTHMIIRGSTPGGCAAMFKGCVNLFHSPLLTGGQKPGENFPFHTSYGRMFQGCPNLNRIMYNYGQWHGTDGWVDEDFENAGTFACRPPLYNKDDPDSIVRSSSACPENFTPCHIKDWAIEPTSNPDSEPHTTIYGQGVRFTALESGSIQIMRHGTDYEKLKQFALEYRREGGDSWYDFSTDVSIAVEVGESVLMRAKGSVDTGFPTNVFGVDEENYYSFVLNGRFEVSGVLDLLISQILVDQSLGGVLYEAPILSDYHCYGMFKDCLGLVSGTNLFRLDCSSARYCFASMFEGCVNLINTPVPLTMLDVLPEGICKNMFKGCLSLTVGGVPLHFEGVAPHCYESMYEGCSSLNRIYDDLPTEVLAEACYKNMYKETAIEYTPALPAVELAASCYEGMFADCASLATAPELPATILRERCYFEMFAGCASLETAPELPALTLADNSYEGMFVYCEKLSSVKTYQDSADWTNSRGWLYGVAANGTFQCKATFDTSTRSSDSCPVDWEVVTITDEEEGA